MRRQVEPSSGVHRNRVDRRVRRRSLGVFEQSAEEARIGEEAAAVVVIASIGGGVGGVIFLVHQQTAGLEHFINSDVSSDVQDGNVDSVAGGFEVFIGNVEEHLVDISQV